MKKSIVFFVISLLVFEIGSTQTTFNLNQANDFSLNQYKQVQISPAINSKFVTNYNNGSSVSNSTFANNFTSHPFLFNNYLDSTPARIDKQSVIRMNRDAWLYPEHRWIAQLAIEKLGPVHRKTLEMMWAEARMGHEDRLSEMIVDPEHSLDPVSLDLASWPAIAGDHSCSPAEMLNIILDSDWILLVDHVATRLQHDLASASRRDQTTNAIRNSDIRLQRADADYATRAGSNNVHFLLVRTSIRGTAEDYFNECLKEGAPLNALGAYAMFHTIALQRAEQASKAELTQEQRSAILLAALANETFALHFLEDAYASGHVAGTWGNAAQRKGTHDHYNEAGLEVETWDDQRLVLTGDAHMRPEDAEIVAESVRKSLAQLCLAMEKETKGDLPPAQDIELLPDSFSVCSNEQMPNTVFDMDLLNEVLITTPMPGLSEGLGQLGRFRSELGPFIGVSSAVEASSLGGGFGPDQVETGVIGSIEATWS